jgi:hypothetical protein
MPFCPNIKQGLKCPFANSLAYYSMILKAQSKALWQWALLELIKVVINDFWGQCYKTFSTSLLSLHD